MSQIIKNNWTRLSNSSPTLETSSPTDSPKSLRQAPISRQNLFIISKAYRRTMI